MWPLLDLEGAVQVVQVLRATWDRVFVQAAVEGALGQCCKVILHRWTAARGQTNRRLMSWARVKGASDPSQDASGHYDHA